MCQLSFIFPTADERQPWTNYENFGAVVRSEYSNI